MTFFRRPKVTSYEYGDEYQQGQVEKYHNRANNHWKARIELAIRLVDEFMQPRFNGRPLNEIIVVDVGCSIGTFAIEFAKLGYRTFGIDFDPAALEIAKQLAQDEKVMTEFVQGDISEWNYSFPPIDIAICFDIFEHLHDDELGSLLIGIRKQLSSVGAIVFHTFPTQWDYLFYRRASVRGLLWLFSWLPSPIFERFVKSIASFIDMTMIAIKGKTYREIIKYDSHCNPTTQERLVDILRRAGYRLIYINTSQIYTLDPYIQQRFKRQPISFRNIYGVATTNENI